MKKIYYLLFLLLIFIGCHKEELNEPPQFKESLKINEPPAENKLEILKFENLPSYIENFDNLNKKEISFGQIDKSKKAFKIKTTTGKVTYTIALVNQNRNVYDNLLLLEQDKNQKAYFIRYEPTPEWLSSSENLDNFSGDVTIFNDMGTEINKITLVNGVEDTDPTGDSNQKVTCYVYLESTVTICTDGGSIEGSVNQIGYTCHTTYNYKWNCVADSGGSTGGTGGSSGGDLGGGGSGGTGGGSAPASIDSELETAPIIMQLDNPCEQMDKLAKDPSFINKMKDLQSKTNQNYESGYVIKRDGDALSYTSIQGDSNQGQIDFAVNDKIDGYMHNHYTGLLSIFSGTDIRAMFQLYQGSHINRLMTFTMTVVTANGTSYALKVSDYSKFISFGNNYLSSDSSFNSFESIYSNLYNISPSNSNTNNETNFLRMLDQLDSGLKLFKGNSNFDDWTPIDVSATGAVVENNC